ncbi:MAG: hypothetical protein EHM41_00165 [Chloroflexi bacterium]|nr:MAG: hypothetical protein EHM41_00165 [Chloroflexota bacterium]
MKIIKLESQNVKKLKAISITPESNMVVIGGNNEQGKTSTLDSIMFALAGKKSYDKAPVRKGTKSAKISLDLGEVGLPEILITRTITESGGGQISITNAEGQQFASPQSMLDKLTGKLTFDPFAFAQMEEKKQLETLKQLVGLDFTALDIQRQQIYSARTVVNAEVKSLKARVDSIPVQNAPDEEVSVSDLTNKLGAAQTVNDNNEALRNQIKDITAAVVRTVAVIDQLEAQLKAERRDLEQNQSLLDSMTSLELIDEPTAPILQQIQDADATNQKVRLKKQRKEMEKEHSAKLIESEELTRQIDEIDQQKSDTLSAAKFPVEGLSFDETGVSFNGIPFPQCSGAQRLRISVAMGMALNPDLRVLLLRDGSLLDSENLKLITEMADTENFQIWMERVGDGKECTVVLEEGEVRG